MGSPCDPDTKGIDPSVGGLVWVRRRNGSWWPGRIMGVDELSESCLVSPRSGTPVKLLGREDASVDWYNLEKSKRVKAFRCGEYDECIEKAKASVANSSKKAVKYARREDAILHALELENALQPIDHPDFCSRLDRSGGEQNGVTESLTLPHPGKEIEHMAEESSSSGDMSNSAQELSQSGVSFEEPNQICASKEQSVQRRRRKTPNDSEDDGTEGNKRMRGLEDLGMSVISSLKRKTSQVANVHEFLKRKNRRRPLTKVLESTTMVSVPVICEQLDSPNGSPLPGVSDSKVSGLESRESKGSFAMVVNKKSDSTGVSCENGTLFCASEHACDASLIKQENEISSMSGLQENDSSDRLFDVPFVGEGKHSAGLSPIFVSCSSQKPQVGAGVQSSPSSQVETISLGNEDFNESGSTSSGAADMNNISQGIEKGTSKWQLKGKRNSRHTTKNRKQYSRKYVEVDDESNAYLPSLGPRDHYSLGSSLKIDRNPICKSLTLDSGTCRAKSKPVKETKVNDFWGWSRLSHKEPHIGTKTAEVKLLLDCSPPPQRSLPYRQSRFSVNPKYQMSDFSVRNYDADFSLYDVNLEVKASYRPQHVPYISLMSKLNGQAIIGHPLTVEVLDDGFCDIFISGPECYLTSSSCEFDGLEENTSALEGVDVDYEVKPNLGCVRIPTKHLTLQPCVSPSKSPKRKNGLLSKKIRKLSSLTGSHKLSEVEIKPVVEKLKGPAIACVPLKVAFSRINAALKSSMRPAPRILTSSKL